MSKSKIPLLPLLILIALVGLEYGGFRLKQNMDISSRVPEETKAETAERKECEEHLALFYKAWKQYKADNKGADPRTIQALIPKYIPDVSVLMCPTAVRMDKNKVRLDRGTIEINRQNVDITYGFRWMSAGFSMMAKKQGDKIPLVICKCHQQAMYCIAYKKQFREAAFDDEERAKLVSEVANAPILGVRMNGKVDTLDSATDR